MTEQKENRRAKMTKLLLKTSLTELMRSKPINRITIRELCANADVNRSTFYLYYKDQYDLLSEIENELLRNAQTHLEKIDSDYGSIQYLEELLSYIKNNADIFKTLLCVQDNLLFQSAFVKVSLENLRKQLLLNCSEPILSYVHEFLLSGCLSMIKRWINAEFELSCSDMSKLIFRLADQAISEFS
ncbi:TetR/AcrR family transcriptional regulator [Scatolibacter rhodanostii]|uniref:TetR/AcrR family transcriptional regulator n=1 Tax=Scatolibacter rhodanostii TaxID=2014781 RepID=UPI000C089765|nr:TetR/AcrR family transcriptional regulator [Scatolibacter rhodanostii]